MFCQILQDTPVAIKVREDPLLFPVIEAAHVLAACFVVGSVAVVDLRLLGVNAIYRSVRQIMKHVLPLTWCAFLCAVLTGATLFSTDPVEYSHNGAFRVKFILLGLAAVNVVAFHSLRGWGGDDWDGTDRTPRFARLAGVISLLLWIGITACGRAIGFAADM